MTSGRDGEENEEEQGIDQSRKKKILMGCKYIFYIMGFICNFDLCLVGFQELC